MMNEQSQAGKFFSQLAGAGQNDPSPLPDWLDTDMP